MAGFVKAAKTGDIVPGGGKMVEVAGKKIAIPPRAYSWARPF